VGDETVQNENGKASFGPFQQDKRMYYYEGSWVPIEWTNQHGAPSPAVLWQRTMI
jgi:hypothetical protein